VREVIRLSSEAPFNVPLHARRIIFGPVHCLSCRLAGVRVGKGVRFFGAPIVRRWRGSTITIGAGCELRSSPRSNVLGLAHPVVLSTMTSNARIDIAERCGLSGATLCAADRISIGPGCIIGADALITDNDHHALAPASRRRNSLESVSVSPVSLGANVFVGAKAIILKGSSIGEGAVIGAGAVVSGDVPANSIAAGNPARVVASVLDAPSESATTAR